MLIPAVDIDQSEALSVPRGPEVMLRVTAEAVRLSNIDITVAIK